MEIQQMKEIISAAKNFVRGYDQIVREMKNTTLQYAEGKIGDLVYQDLLDTIKLHTTNVNEAFHELEKAMSFTDRGEHTKEIGLAALKESMSSIQTGSVPTSNGVCPQ